MAFVSLSKMPTPPTTRVANIPSMSGGLNIHDLPWQLAENQSPEMKNMWWEDGALRSRPAEFTLSTVNLSDGTDKPCACYPLPYKGWYICHRGDRMWAVSEDLQVQTEVDSSKLTYWYYDPVLNQGGPKPHLAKGNYGTFVLHGGTLYYKGDGFYGVLEETDAVIDEARGLRGLAIRNTSIFVPTVLINADPAVPGAGDLYQPRNVLTTVIYVLYSAEEGSATFAAPQFLLHPVDTEILDDDGNWIPLANSGAIHNHNTQTSTVSIKDPSAVHAGTNNVRIKFTFLEPETPEEGNEQQKQRDRLMSCNIATVYGGGDGLCMVLSGCKDQPNAWFWSANTDLAMDPTYFPAEHYNLAGDFSDPITAFGLQQNQLVIFQKNRIGAAVFGTADIEGRIFITMDYRTVNPGIGCDLPGSVQLVENNLVFANSRLGVMLIRDTTSADENNITRLSQNVDGSSAKPGLLYDIKNAKHPPTSIDDGKRYWLAANGHVWIWDYRLSKSVSKADDLSWFYFDNIGNPACWFGQGELTEQCNVGWDGRVRKFTDNNHGETFEASVALPVLNFGTYEVLKNVTKAIFAFDDSSEGKVNIEYQTDYGTRTDPTPISFSTAGDTPFAEVFVRKPRCLNVRHFLCRLKSSINGVGKVAFTGAQIHYTVQGIDR